MSQDPSNTALQSSPGTVLARCRTPDVLIRPLPTHEGLACLSRERYLPGERVELVALRGLLSIDAVVTACQPAAPDEDGAYRLELRYHGLSQSLRVVLEQELRMQVSLAC